MTFSKIKPDKTNQLFPITSKKEGSFAVSVANLTNDIPGLQEALVEGIRVYMEHVRARTWCIKINPPPEWIATNDISDIPTGEYGIYKYLLKGEVVYYGEGILRQRFLEHRKKNWEYDCYQYALIESKEKGVKLEGHLLAEYRKKHKGLNPKYNKNNGKQVKE